MSNLIKHPNAQIPILALQNTVVFPGQTMPLLVGRAQSSSALEAARINGGWMLAIAQRSEKREDHIVTKDDLYKIGSLCRIDQVDGDAEHGYRVIITGGVRFQVTEIDSGPGYMRGSGFALEDVQDMDVETSKILLDNMKQLSREILGLFGSESSRAASMVEAIDDPVLLTHMISQHIEVSLPDRQELLEMVSLKTRCLRILDLMVRQRENLKLRKEVSNKISSKMGKQQRQNILREQIRLLQEELDDDKTLGGGKDYYQKIEEAQMPEDVERVALEQMARLESLGPQSPETNVIRNYLDLLCAMPWKKSSDSSIDLDRAREILDAEHYGLDKVKKRIIQHLAVMKMKSRTHANAPAGTVVGPEKKGSILLLVGPPGVGKTSLGKSIARALSRKFVRVSLGGVRDDAEIRGHRRTYVGAMPGRIVDGIKRAGENNPVFVLDEIDKMNRGYGGDPASAMLEVLDPEQNTNFMDHYLDVPFDLSNVFFVATANSLETIPGPLLDRMEVIQLSGYTTAEKLHICKTHLVPRQLDEHGLTKDQLEISEEVQLRLISAYTREAGVRDLQRMVAAVIRGSTEQVLKAGAVLPVRPTIADLDEILGQERFSYEEAQKQMPPGVVTGLAWTPMGGDILFVEASAMPGNGKVTLTGQLGDVMKESAQIALSLIRSRLGPIPNGFLFDKSDIHIHVPAGAIPKDGPSAGVTMFTTIASLVLGKSVDPKLAMTGEVTLRGAVTPVGGIKEKIIAAHRAGVKRVVMCKKNERDLREVPLEIKEEMHFSFVENVDELITAVFGESVTLIHPLLGAGMTGTDSNSLSRSTPSSGPAVACNGKC